MNNVLNITPKTKPIGFTGIMKNPNLAKTPVTETNITAEIASKARTEDTRFSNRNPEGESFVYFVTKRIEREEYKSDEAMVTAAPERESINKFPYAVAV